MICTVIQNKTYREIYELLETGDIEMAEIRLDSCPLSTDEIKLLFEEIDIPLVATCRINKLAEHLQSENPDKDESKIKSIALHKAESKLLTAIKAGAEYVDLELEAPTMMSKIIRREAAECGTYLIRSYHNFKNTDSIESLKALTDKCLSLGADIAKIVTTAQTDEDLSMILSLYNYYNSSSLIAFCMGDMGKQTRIESLKRGAPFTYAALNSSEIAAPGQWTTAELFNKIYGNKYSIGKGLHDKDISIPSSKSFAQRAIIAAAIAEGTSILRNYTPCGDNESAISVARALGAEVIKGISYNDGDIDKDKSTLTIKGIGGKKLLFDKNILHVGESGLLARLMIPIISEIGIGDTVITGEKTLLNRPLKGAREIMKSFGISLECTENKEDTYIPLRIKGRFTPKKAKISGKDGSQLISGLLAALPISGNSSEIIIENPKSIPYIFMTLDVLKKFGIKIQNEMEGNERFFETEDWSLCDAIVCHISGGQTYKATQLDIEADWSSAAIFLVAGAIFGHLSVKGLDINSLQADLCIMDILASSGAALSQEEDTGIIHVHKSPLYSFDIDASNCPDLFPILSVLAAFCEGKSTISGVGRLASKESDRGKVILEMLLKMGVKAKIHEDQLIIEGHSLCSRILSGNLLKGGSYSSYSDHRIVMALKVASLGADSPIDIDDIECVNKSFPSFLELFKIL